MKLFAIYVGGIHEKASIELHDIFFVIAENIEATYPILREKWWGIPKSLHIDSWGELEYVDNYHINLSQEPATNNTEKLYFINLGGYDPEQFTELHKNTFVIAKDPLEAKEKGKNIISHWTRPHKDYVYEVENLVDVNQKIASTEWHIHLTPTKSPKPFTFISDYVPIAE